MFFNNLKQQSSVPVLVNLLGSVGDLASDSNLDGRADGLWMAGVTGSSLADGTQSFTATARYGGMNTVGHFPSVGDVLYTCLMMKADRIGAYLAIQDDNVEPLLAVSSINHTGSGLFEFRSVVNTVIGPGANVGAWVSDNSVSGWTQIQFRRMFLFNLSRNFGRGNEPTKAQLDAFMQTVSTYFVRRDYIKVA